MEVYRIAKAKYADDLSGTGARLFGGRWNPKGMAMLYTAESRSMAALELLVHLEPNLLPEQLKLITISIPANLPIEQLKEEILPDHWKAYPAPIELSEIGKSWLLSKRTLALKVPSVIIPKEFNILINPVHKDFQKLQLVSIEDFPLDQRLVEK